MYAVGTSKSGCLVLPQPSSYAQRSLEKHPLDLLIHLFEHWEVMILNFCQFAYSRANGNEASNNGVETRHATPHSITKSTGECSVLFLSMVLEDGFVLLNSTSTMLFLKAVMQQCTLGGKNLV